MVNFSNFPWNPDCIYTLPSLESCLTAERWMALAGYKQKSRGVAQSG